MTAGTDVDEDRCVSGGCDEIEDCPNCDGSGDDGGGDLDGRGCYSCGGSGQVVPDHCCACGGSPYCQCCKACGASCVADCRCPIPTERGGKQVTV